MSGVQASQRCLSTLVDTCSSDADARQRLEDYMPVLVRRQLHPAANIEALLRSAGAS